MTTATANKVKAPKKGFKLDRQMIPTLAAVVIFILMIIMGQALFGTYIRLGFISSLFIDHAYLIILAVAMTLPILTGGIDLSVGAIVAITAVVGLKLANAGVPAFLVMIIMLLIGAVFGLLAGGLASGFVLAVFMANSGGAWDNAKKYIEQGHVGGKGSESHKAAVIGDTVGDPFKDTSGPSLNILIKLMSMVAIVTAGVNIAVTLF